MPHKVRITTPEPQKLIVDCRLQQGENHQKLEHPKTKDVWSESTRIPLLVLNGLGGTACKYYKHMDTKRVVSSLATVLTS